MTGVLVSPTYEQPAGTRGVNAMRVVAAAVLPDGATANAPFRQADADFDLNLYGIRFGKTRVRFDLAPDGKATHVRLVQLVEQ